MRPGCPRLYGPCVAVTLLFMGCAQGPKSEARTESSSNPAWSFAGNLAEGALSSISGEDTRQYEDRTAMDRFEHDHYAR